MTRWRDLVCGALLLMAAGCAQQQTLYHWDGYDERLYQHYRSPQERDAWVSGMRQVVAAAEQQGRRVPPGVYAEYGYALLEQGDTAGAIAWFEKERALWPESAQLMDRMIASARRAKPPPPAIAAPPSQPPRGAPDRESM